jgi:hypothetical protein
MTRVQLAAASNFDSGAVLNCTVLYVCYQAFCSYKKLCIKLLTV